MGGILGFTWNTTIRDCYNSGLIGNNLSPKVGGVIGSVLDMSDEERSNIENCYNSGLVYTASKEETTNEENTLLAKGGKTDKAELKYFRHLYNLRWSADWDITNKGIYTLTPQASNSTGAATTTVR